MLGTVLLIPIPVPKCTKVIPAHAWLMGHLNRCACGSCNFGLVLVASRWLTFIFLPLNWWPFDRLFKTAHQTASNPDLFVFTALWYFKELRKDLPLWRAEIRYWENWNSLKWFLKAAKVWRALNVTVWEERSLRHNEVGALKTSQKKVSPILWVSCGTAVAQRWSLI